jgi:hypothetical protein
MHGQSRAADQRAARARRQRHARLAFVGEHRRAARIRDLQGATEKSGSDFRGTQGERGGNVPRFQARLDDGGAATPHEPDRHAIENHVALDHVRRRDGNRLFGAGRADHADFGAIGREVQAAPGAGAERPIAAHGQERFRPPAGLRPIRGQLADAPASTTPHSRNQRCRRGVA